MTDLDELAVQVGREEAAKYADETSAILGARAMLAKLREMGLVVDTLSQGALDAINERRRQVEVEGYTPEHDDAHDRGELAGAAAAYAAYRSQVGIWQGSLGARRVAVELWPWPSEGSYKPKGRYDDLKRAAAFLIAEMDRLNRIGGRS